MRTIYFLLVLICMSLLIHFGCSIRAPELSVTGEKTALEREVIGTYQEIADDTWMVASSRDMEEGETVTLSPEKKQVLEALREQQFNKDDVDEFKQLGYVGENKEGFLIIRDPEFLEKDVETKVLVETIVKEENEDRVIISNRVIELNQSLKKIAKEDVQAVFAKMYQENSPGGTWVQLSDGKWEKK